MKLLSLFKKDTNASSSSTSQKTDKVGAKYSTKVKVGLFLLALYIIAMFFVVHLGYLMDTEGMDFSEAIGEVFSHAFSAPFEIFPFPAQAVIYMLIFTVCVAGLVFVVFIKHKLRAHDDLSKIAGDAEWLNSKQLVDYTSNFTDTKHLRNNAIMSNDISLSMNAKKTNRNLNVLVIGGSGTGKSFRIIGPNIMQRNCSMVITDPSGGLYKGYGSFLEYYGYKVKCFNLDHMERSNHYNPFNYIASDKDIEILVTMLISNTTSPGSKGDDFWEKCEIALLCALIAYLYHYRPKAEHNFSQVKDLIRAADIDENDSSTQSKLDLLFEELRKTHPDCFAMTQYDTFRLGAGKTLKSILISCAVRLQAFDLEDVRALTDTDDIDLDSIADEKTAIFIIVPTGEKTFNFIAGLMYSQLFTRLYRYCENDAEFSWLVKDSDGEVVRTFRATTIEESEKAKEKAQEFLEMCQSAKVIQRKNLTITEQTDKGEKKMEFWEIRDKDEKNILAYRGSKEIAEEALEKMKSGQVISNTKGPNDGQQCPIHVRFLLDEFANTGKIPDFTEKISTIRKYEISTTIILQSLKQIKNLYEKEWDVISANCDTSIYLGGGNDTETTEWLNKLLGKQTVRSMSESLSSNGGSESFQMTSKDLYSMSEFRTMPNQECVVIPRSQNPCKGLMYDTLNHPEWNLRCSLPSYKFSSLRYSYIKKNTTIKQDSDKNEYGADKIMPESLNDKQYRVEQNKQAQLQADEVKSNINIDSMPVIGDITIIDIVKPPVVAPVDESDAESVNTSQATSNNTSENASETFDSSQIEQMMAFNFDDDMSFSVAPME